MLWSSIPRACCFSLSARIDRIMNQSTAPDSPHRWLAIPLVVAASASLVLLRLSGDGLAASIGLDGSPVATEIAYQITSLGLALVVLALAYALAPSNLADFAGPGDIGAEVEPARWMGLDPDPEETWRQIGRNFAVIITLVTAIAVFFQVVRGGEPSPSHLLSHLHWVVGFALVNSFVEESICRLSLVAPLSEIASRRTIYLSSAAIFGGVHYFGTPGGLPGVLLAGFLGWFLAKSVVETRGIFWAWLIHFLQDVVIFAGLFLATGA